MTDNMLTELYENYHKIYTDASKASETTGIDITDLRLNRLAIGINNKIQITNAELVAILRALSIAVDSNDNRIAILTDSLEGCRQIETGKEDNYIIKLIWSEIQLQPRKEFVIQ